MSIDKDDRSLRDSAIRNARLRLIQLEIAAHRVKAELARLEAQREDDAADRLMRGLPRIDCGPSVAPSWKRVVPTVAAEPEERPSAVKKPVPAAESEPVTDHQSDPPRGRTTGRKRRRQNHPQQSIQVAPARRPRRRAVGKSRKLRRAWALSAAAHVFILSLAGLATFVTIHSRPLPLLASAVDIVENFQDTPQLHFEQLSSADLHVEEAAASLANWDASDLSLTEAVPLDGLPAGEVGAEFGFADALPGDIGTLTAGLGEAQPGGSGNSGRTRFFGTEAQGTRTVFVVDNSGSMQEGRMETTFLEIVKSVQDMRSDQYFYVVFYSDHVYPLFYPESAAALVPATKANKYRLQQWLATVELCSGGALREAMELVVPLEPQVVYLLSDGAIGSQRVMQFMTEPHDWTFAVHTLGMTVRNAGDAAKLSAIAAAHNGTFRMVRPSPVAIQLATERPIKYNRQKGTGWGSPFAAQ